MTEHHPWPPSFKRDTRGQGQYLVPRVWAYKLARRWAFNGVGLGALVGFLLGWLLT